MSETKQITEEHLDRAIAAAKEGHLNGLTYDQSSWCGTACCVLGFARHEAGIEQVNEGPQPGEIVDTPRARIIARLMLCASPSILSVMERVTTDGKIDLSGADLRGAVLRWAVLSGADLRRADLSRADLRGAVLSAADLSEAVLRGADLSEAFLSGAFLSGAFLSRADLRGAVLSAADLSRADLSRADLSRADLRGAVLSRADLSRADLSRADLSRARAWDCDKYVPATDAWLREQGAIL